MSKDRDLEVLAAAVHGAVALGNALGIVFNIRRRNYLWALIHAAGVTVHVYATLNHAKEARG
jgi:hypothetical protein